MLQEDEIKDEFECFECKKPFYDPRGRNIHMKWEHKINISKYKGIEYYHKIREYNLTGSVDLDKRTTDDVMSEYNKVIEHLKNKYRYGERYPCIRLKRYLQNYKHGSEIKAMLIKNDIIVIETVLRDTRRKNIIYYGEYK
jgi:hypothetical protein